MGSVTPTVVPGDGYVRVEVNWQDFSHYRHAWIYRTVAGADTKIRDGDYAWLSNGLAVAFDHEAPLDTPVTYKSVLPLNWNGDFETGVLEWLDTTSNGTVGTVTQSLNYAAAGNGSLLLVPDGASATAKAVSEFIPVTPSARNANPFFNSGIANWAGANGAAVSADSTAHEGTGSLLVTPNGVSSTPQAQSEEISVVAGRSYTYSAWIRVSPGGSASRDVGIVWFDASHVFISGSTTTLTPTPGTWTQYGPVVAVAPVGAAFARLITNGPGVLTAANTWRADEFILWDPTTATQYTLTGNLMLPSYWTGGIGLQLQWYNGTTLLATTGALSDTTPFPGTWGAYTLTGTDVATANQVRIVAGAAGTPPTTLLLYADEVYLTTPASTVLSGPVVVPSSGSGWWTDPLHPATKVKLQIDLARLGACSQTSGVAYLGVGPEKSWAANSAAFDIEGSAYRAASFGVRRAPKSTMRVGLETLTDLAKVRALHASGAPLLLQLDARWGEPDQYQLHGDVTEGRLNGDQSVQWRIASSDFTEVLPSPGPAEGTLRTRYADLNRYTTFAAATSAAVTWLDALRGNMAL